MVDHLIKNTETSRLDNKIDSLKFSMRHDLYTHGWYDGFVNAYELYIPHLKRIRDMVDLLP